ncbi:hypothetical protein PP1Y_AT1483 [Novosphingobium sp. PP1Y]|nr:hypothetical protein PP1Y_AT1483 [Novosphingobium sp. PP1Y]
MSVSLSQTCRLIPEILELRLTVQRQVIGLLGRQNLRDQRFGVDATFDDPCRCRGLHDRTLARAATVARTARDKNTEGGGHEIEPFSHVFADLMVGAATTAASLALDVDDLFNPLQVSWQRSPVGLARSPAADSVTYRSSRSKKPRCRDTFRLYRSTPWNHNHRLLANGKSGCAIGSRNTIRALIEAVVVHGGDSRGGKHGRGLQTTKPPAAGRWGLKSYTIGCGGRI